MPTLDALLALPELGLRVPVPHRTDRAVRWVATSELADPSPYLEGGELLLTTGLVAQDWAGYLDRVAAAGVVGVGFGVGLSHREIPAGLRAAAEAAGPTLVEVPEATPFIAISKAVARLIAAEEEAATARALALQQELTRAITGRAGIRGLLRALGRAVDGEAGLVDADGAAVVPRGFRPGPAVLDALATLRAGRHRGAVTETGAAGAVVVQPVRLAGDELFLVLTGPGPLDAVARAGLTTAAALLTLDAERTRAAAEAELGLRDCAARLVLEGAPEAAAGVARLLPGASPLPARIRVLRVATTGDTLRSRLARSRPAALTTAGDLAVLVADDDTADLVDEVIGSGARVGIGPSVPLARAAQGDDAARAALEATGPGTPVVRWEERFRGRVRAGLTDAAARAAARDVLGGLTGSAVLRTTLRSYLHHLGRWQPTAAELGIHRNTLRKRMARIEALTGRDVDSAAGRADLWIALTVLDEPDGGAGAPVP